jgi:site-specific recombinase XerD
VFVIEPHFLQLESTAMTPWQNRADALTKRMADDMKLRNFSPRTIDAYTYHVGRFARFLGRSPDTASPEDVRSFQLHLIEERKVGWSSFNQAVCGLRFLFRITYPREWAVRMVPFGKRPKKLPTVLGAEEVTSLLSCVKSLKHRTFLLTLYAAGLRLNEAAQLTIVDIDSQRMQLRIAHGKGAKERLVPLSPRLLEALRTYWKDVRSPQWLFPGKTFDVPLSSTTIQKMCKAAALKAGIRKHVTPHTLRHSYATGLMEAGVDLLTIGRLLGHRSFSTTMIYLHVRKTHLGSVPSPIDWLPVRQLPGWVDPTIPHRPNDDNNPTSPTS